MSKAHLNIYFKREGSKLFIHLNQIYKKYPDDAPHDENNFLCIWYRQTMVEEISIFNKLKSQFYKKFNMDGVPCSYRDEAERSSNKAYPESDFNYDECIFELPAASWDFMQTISAIENALHDYCFDYRGEKIDTTIQFHDDFIRQTQALPAVSDDVTSLTRKFAEWLKSEFVDAPEELARYQKVNVALSAMLAEECGSLNDAMMQYLSQNEIPEYMKSLPKPWRHLTPKEVEQRRIDTIQFLSERPGNGLQDANANALKYVIGRDAWLGTQDISNLALSSKSMHRIFQPVLNERTINRLLLHIVRGEKAQALELLNKKPELLLMRGTVVDYSGRTIENVTPLQCAYGAGDVDMVKMLIQKFERISDGSSQALAQLNEYLFENKHTEKPYNYFARLADVISNDKFENGKESAKLNATLKQFRADNQPALITGGMHFNLNTLFNAVCVLMDYYGRWNDEQRAEYWIKIFGFVERQLPACDAQAFCTGLSNIVYDGKPLERSLSFIGVDKYYPLANKAESGFGYDFGMISYEVKGNKFAKYALPNQRDIPNYHYLYEFMSVLSKYIYNKRRDLRIIYEDLVKSQSYWNRCTIL